MESWAALRMISVQARSSKGRRPRLGRQEQRRQRLGQPLEGPLGPGRRLLHVDPVGPHAHQQVGAGPRPQLAAATRAAPRWAPTAGSRAGSVTARSNSPWARLASATTRPSQGWGRRWSEPFMSRRGSPGRRNAPNLLDVGLEPAYQRLGVVGEGGAVAVPGHQVLGPDPGSVGGRPTEGVAVDRRGHAPPHHGVLEPGLGQDLGHLGHVAEHVGQVARRPSPHRRPRPAGARPAGSGRWSRPTPGIRPSGCTRGRR